MGFLAKKLTVVCKLKLFANQNKCYWTNVDEDEVVVGNTTKFDDFLGQMAQVAIEFLRSAHDEDLQMVKDKTRPEMAIPEMRKFKRRKEFVCQLKKSTKLFWGNEKCNLNESWSANLFYLKIFQGS